MPFHRPRPDRIQMHIAAKLQQITVCLHNNGCRHALRIDSVIAGSKHELAGFDLIAVGNVFEQGQGPLMTLEDSMGSGTLQENRNSAIGVGDQQYLRGAGKDVKHLPDDAVRGVRAVEPVDAHADHRIVAGTEFLDRLVPFREEADLVMRDFRPGA